MCLHCLPRRLLRLSSRSPGNSLSVRLPRRAHPLPFLKPSLTGQPRRSRCAYMPRKFPPIGLTGFGLLMKRRHCSWPLLLVAGFGSALSLPTKGQEINSPHATQAALLELNQLRGVAPTAHLSLASTHLVFREAESVETLVALAWTNNFELRLREMAKWRPDSVQHFKDAAELADRHYRLGAVPISIYVELQKQYLEAVESLLDTKKDALDSAQQLELLTGLSLPLANTSAKGNQK